MSKNSSHTRFNTQKSTEALSRDESSLPPSGVESGVAENGLVPEIPASVRTSDVVQGVIAQSFGRADRFRKRIVTALKKDPKTLDPEDIHQMRVSLRQLRSCLQAFSGVIALPTAAQDPQVKKFAQALGSVRDLDIFQGTLQQDYFPQLPDGEQRILLKLLRQLKRQRSDGLCALQQLLKSDRYYQLKKAYTAWLKKPSYALNGASEFTFLAPDLLLPTFSLVLQHPGWFVGVKFVNIIGVQRESLCYEPLLLDSIGIDILQAEEPVWHDLRKRIKQLRYQLMLLSPYLTSAQDTLHPIAMSLKEAQEILGHLQDRSVIRDLLFKFLHQKGLKRHALTTAFAQLDREYLSLWEQWQPLQQRYLNPTFRQELRQLICML